MGTKNTKTTKKQIRKQPTTNFWNKHKHLWKWLGGVLIGLVVLIIVIFIWFRVSPWPGAMVIRYVFEKNGAKTSAALDKHAPASGITVTANQQYKQDDKHALLDVYIPEGLSFGQKLPVVIWTHGGAWISGDKADASAYYRLIAQAGFVVVAPNYSLAPEKKYPTAVHQLNAVHRYVLDNADRFYIDTNAIFLAGDSAGSQLSAQMAALVTNSSYAKEVDIVPALNPEQLKGVVLNCGIYKMHDLAHPNQTLSKIVGWGDSVVVWAYSGTKDFSDPVIKQMSPYFHVTSKFPPTFITGGNVDPLTDVQSKPFADKLESLNVPVTTLFYQSNHVPALPHEYQFDLDNQDGRNALEQILTFLQNHIQER